MSGAEEQPQVAAAAGEAFVPEEPEEPSSLMPAWFVDYVQRPFVDNVGQSLMDAFHLRSSMPAEQFDKEPVLSLDEAYRRIHSSGNGYWTFLCVHALSIVTMIQAVESGGITYITYCAAETYDASDMDEWLLVGAVYLGYFVGGLTLSPLADVVGRRAIILWTTILLVLFGILTACSWNWASLTFTRFMLGFCEGPWMIGMTLLIEVLPTDVRGSLVNFTNIMWGAGSTYSALLAWVVLTYSSWRLYAVLLVAPFAYNIFQLYKLPESPQWLLSQGRHDEALEAVKTIAECNGSPMPCDALEALPGAVLIDTPAHERVWHSFRRTFYEYGELFEQERFTTTWKVLGGWCTVVVVSSCIVLYEGDILYGNDGTCNFQYGYLVICATAEIVGALVVVPLLDRKDLLIGGRIGSQVMMFLVAAVALVLTGGDVTPQLFWAFIARGALVGGTGVSMIQTAEVIDTNHRSTLTGFSNQVMCLVSAIACWWVYSGFSGLVITIGLAVVTLVGIGFFAALPETAGVPLE